MAKHSGIFSQLIAAHANSGCDNVGCYLGIGKTPVIKARARMHGAPIACCSDKP